ncbi:hypothetical protein FKW77_010917 [Venturia effusa]|uniref:Uncharacterized protein n=1 Tax=Venturia effusa TaxID=50376 RepID=A0A517KYU6_9PEZI|nr:hypothetical protein FKW77_010917 [Venturia effusa]
MLSPAPYSMVMKSQSSTDKTEEDIPPAKSGDTPDEQHQQGSNITTPSNSPTGPRALSRDPDLPKTPTSPSAFRKPNSGNRRKSVTFSSMLDTFPAPRHSDLAQQENIVAPSAGSPKQPPARPARGDSPDSISGMQHQLSDLETGFPGAKSLATKNVSGDRTDTLLKANEVVVNSDIPVVISPWKSRPALFRQPSDAVRTKRSSSHYCSPRTSDSSPAAGSDAKPVSKVKALAQAFNNLTAPKDSIKNRASSSGHKKSGSWTEKIRRSISLSSKKSEAKDNKEVKMIDEEAEPKQSVREAPKSKELGGKETERLGLEEAVLQNEKQPLLTASPPGSSSMSPESHSLQEALDALGLGNDGRVSFQYSMDPSSSLHSRFATGDLMPGLEQDVHLANSPSGSPSMQATYAPFVFPARPGSDSIFDDDTRVFTGDEKTPFLAPTLNRKSSSIYSRSEKDEHVPKPVDLMDGAVDTGSLPHKQRGAKDAALFKPNAPAESLHVHKRTPNTGSPAKTRSHKRSNATNCPISPIALGTNHSAYLAATPSTAASQRTYTPAGIAYGAYLAEDYTEYLDQNFPHDATPPPIPARNPARLARPNGRTQHFPSDTQPQNFQEESQQLETTGSGHDSPSSPDSRQSHSWASQIAIAGRDSRASRHISATSEQLSKDVQNRAHTEGASSAALPRLRREARDLGRLSEKSAEGLVGKEQFAGEDRGDDSAWT